MGRNREAKGLIEAEEHHNHKPQMKERLRNTVSFIYRRRSGVNKEHGSWYRSRWMYRGKGKDVRRKQTAFVPH